MDVSKKEGVYKKMSVLKVIDPYKTRDITKLPTCQPKLPIYPPSLLQISLFTLRKGIEYLGRYLCM